MIDHWLPRNKSSKNLSISHGHISLYRSMDLSALLLKLLWNLLINNCSPSQDGERLPRWSTSYNRALTFGFDVLGSAVTIVGSQDLLVVYLSGFILGLAHLCWFNSGQYTSVRAGIILNPKEASSLSSVGHGASLFWFLVSTRQQVLQQQSCPIQTGMNSSIWRKINCTSCRNSHDGRFFLTAHY